MKIIRRRPLRPWRQVPFLFVLFSLWIVPVAIAGDFSELVIFGDSLSDSGNHFIAFGTTARPPFEPIPDASYDIGGHHFSNGATWAERLAEALKVPTSGWPALRVPGVFTNYAVGRARARPDAPAFPFYDLGTQVNLFLSDSGGHASPDRLYAVWIGANDLQDALNALASDPSGATSGVILQAAIGAVATNIQTLWAFGARTFLIPNVPNLALTPAVRALGPDAQLGATLLTNAYNAALEQVMTALQPLPQVRFVRLDVDALFAAVLAAPVEFGLTSVDAPCLTFGVIGEAICSVPNQYLFWDGVHPTTVGHRIIAGAAYLALDSQ